MLQELKLDRHQNIIAEQSVLGAVLIDSSCLDTILEILPSADYFYVEEHKTIYSTMLSMYLSGNKIDVVSIYDKITSNDEIEKERCKSYLLELAQTVPSITNIEVYAKIVKEKKEIRDLISTAYEIIENANLVDDAEKVLELAEQKIYEIRFSRSNVGFYHVKHILLNICDRLDEIKSKGRISGLPTGFFDLDNVIMGLNNTDLILVAGRPGMGKTSFALNLAFNAAKNEKIKVAIFSLEMSKEQLVSRMISSEGKIESMKFKTGNFNENDWNSFISMCDLLRSMDIMIDDSAGITVSEMKAKLKKLKNVNLVVIDYLQLISSNRDIQNRVQEISTITRQLKIMAKELKVPVICLSQLSRASEHRTNHRPLLSDLRDSGSIEQDADIVMFLYREAYYSNTNVENIENNNKCECIIAKNRHGETCTVEMYWDGTFTCFNGIAEEH